MNNDLMKILFLFILLHVSGIVYSEELISIPMPLNNDKSYKFYDASGSYQFRIESNGHEYDRTGKYCGKIDKNNKVYNSNNKLIGYWK